MDITAFIRELLFGHDCVIVPGFGGFIGNYSPARIDSSSGTFYPPVKKISFNRNLTHNDGLLVGRISGSSEMTYGDARNAVEKFVSDLRRKIEKGEKVIFDHIGSFYNNQEGSLQFEPDLNVNYHPDSFGLESFQCLPVEGYDVRSRIMKHSDRDPVRQSAVRRNLWRAAVIIPLLSALVFVPLKTDLLKSKVETSSMNPLVNAEFENNKKAVDADVKAEPVIAEDSTAPVKEEISTPEVIVPIPPASGKYTIITGSFRSEENAEKQADLLKAEGFSPEITVAPNGFYRVNALRCSDIATARVKKDSIAAKFPESWISMNK